MGDLVTKDMAKAPNAFFTSIFTGKTVLQQSKGLEKVPSKVGEDQARQSLSKLDVPVGPERMHPRVLRELA